MSALFYVGLVAAILCAIIPWFRDDSLTDKWLKSSGWLVAILWMLMAKSK